MGWDDPRWIGVVLDWRWTGLLARAGLTSAYFVGGVTKLSNVDAAITEQQHFGLHPAWMWAVLTVAIEIVCPLLIVARRLVWLAAGALGVLTAVATYVANDFWNMTGAAQFAAFNGFFEHIGLIAGFVLVALIAHHDGRYRTEDTHAS
jgi:uncharacterized membrane protein YphA (DoxX/SURF4 family)